MYINLIKLLKGLNPLFKNNKLKMIFVFIVIFLKFIQANDKCRVLALEGGGDRGAYHAGAFDALVELLPPNEVTYDIVTGISAGSLNAVAISFFEKGDEKRARDFLNNVWKTIKQENIYKMWPVWKIPFL